MSADLIETLGVIARRAWLGDDWAEAIREAAAEIVRLRGEVKTLAAAVPVARDPASHRWNDDGEKCLVCGDKDWMGGPCSGAIAPAEAKGDFPADALSALRGYRQADMEGVFVTVSREALDMAIERLDTPQPAGGEAVAHIIHMEDAPSSVHITEAGMALGLGRWPVYLEGATPPAAQVQKIPPRLLALFPSKKTLDALDDDAGTGRRPMPFLDRQWLTIAEWREVYRWMEAHPAVDALGAVRELPAQWRHNAQGCGRRDQHAAGTWRSCARELEAALQHRGDSRGGEG